jgi:SAM-dependent methyltransferase
MELEPSGERVIADQAHASPEAYAVYLMHEATYRFAAQYTRGMRVLDFGCGSGYGSAEIAEAAAHVTGVDVSDDAIEYASEHFARDNLAFRTIDPDAPLPFADGSFDTVLSFQVIEHVPDAARYLSEIRRVLVPGGRLVLATPDRSTRLFPGQRPWNRWHLHEYAAAELDALLARFFTPVEVMGMTATPDLLAVELRRARRLKWLTLPFTLPGMPESWRIAALEALHRLRKRGAGQAAAPATPRHYPWDADDVTIAKGASPSTNLVAVAQVPGESRA